MSKMKTAPCKSCDGGTMYRKKKYVLGAGGAILRFFIMIPGVIILIIGLMSFGSAAAGGSQIDENHRIRKDQVKIEFMKRNMPESIIDDIMEDGSYSGDKSVMSIGTQSLVTEAEMTVMGLTIEGGAEAVGAGLAGAFGILMTIGGLVMCAFGFLIGIRKWKLICDSCGTSIAAG